MKDLPDAPPKVGIEKAPNLRTHISDAHSKAVQLHGLIEALDTLENEGTCRNGQASLIVIANQLSLHLSDQLDETNFPSTEGSVSDRDWRKEYDQLEEKFFQAVSLTNALQQLVWQLSQFGIKDPELRQVRSGIVGIGNSLEETLRI